MFLHTEMERRLFQAGLDASKRRFSKDEARDALARYENFSVSASQRESTGTIVRPGANPGAALDLDKERKPKLETEALAARMVDALDQFQEGIGSGFSYGYEVTKFLQLATSYQTLASLGLTGADLTPLRTALDSAASRLEIARLLHESRLASSSIKTAFDEGFRLTFNDERPVLEQLVKAIPGSENEYWALSAPSGFALPPDVNEEIWTVSATSYIDGEKFSVTADKAMTLVDALRDYSLLAAPGPEISTSLSP